MQAIFLSRVVLSAWLHQSHNTHYHSHQHKSELKAPHNTLVTILHQYEELIALGCCFSHCLKTHSAETLGSWLGIFRTNCRLFTHFQKSTEFAAINPERYFFLIPRLRDINSMGPSATTLLISFRYWRYPYGHSWLIRWVRDLRTLGTEVSICET